MDKYFKIFLEFDKEVVDTTISQCIEKKTKGYVCSVEGNILATAFTDYKYNNVVNNALVNICDGGSIAGLLTLIHHKKFKTYIGADMFIQYIKKARYRSFFLGNTIDVLSGLKDNLVKHDPNIETMRFETLPFMSVEDFNYKEIAEMINKDNPDIIWVSLGAPKQEIFMYNLLPYLNHGVMFGFGAIFNFYSGKQNSTRAPKPFLFLKLEWLYRVINDGSRIRKRAWNYLKLIPKLVVSEIKSINNETTRT